MKVFAITIALFLFSSLGLFAQENGDNSSNIDYSDTSKVWVDPYPSWENKGAIALNLGFPGLGLEYARNLNRKWNYRVGLGGLTLKDYSMDLDVNGTPVNTVINFRTLNLDAHMEFHPFKKGSFKMVGGLSYFQPLKGDALITLTEGSSYGDMTISSEEIGEILIEADYSGPAAYLGLGFGRAVPKKRMGFSIDYGAYYVGSPDVRVTATKMLENTSSEEEELEQNMSSYRWFPKISMRLVYKL